MSIFYQNTLIIDGRYSVTKEFKDIKRLFFNNGFSFCLQNLPLCNEQSPSEISDYYAEKISSGVFIVRFSTTDQPITLWVECLLKTFPSLKIRYEYECYLPMNLGVIKGRDGAVQSIQLCNDREYMLDFLINVMKMDELYARILDDAV